MRVFVYLLSILTFACAGDSNLVSNQDAIPLERPVQTMHPVLGVRIADEVDDGSYNRSDYNPPSSVEADIVNQQGGLYSPYSLRCFDSATETDIEHIVAAAEAHASGMYAKTVEDRKAFGKDLDNLTLAAPGLNRHQKSDNDPAEWMPDNNKCWYVGKWVEIKKKYNLTMDQAEADSIAAVYQECDDFGMILPVCETGLAEAEFYDFRWSRWGDSKDEVQSAETDTLAFARVDSTQETGSLTTVLMFNDETSDSVDVVYGFTDDRLQSGTYLFDSDVPASRSDTVQDVLDGLYGPGEEGDGYTQWERNERTTVVLYPVTAESAMSIIYKENTELVDSVDDSTYNQLPLRTLVPLD